MKQAAEAPQKSDNTVKVKLLSDYWPTDEELAMNPGHESVPLEPPPNPEIDPGVAINTETRFRAGSEATLSMKSAFRLVEEGKAKRADWNL